MGISLRTEVVAVWSIGNRKLDRESRERHAAKEMGRRKSWVNRDIVTSEYLRLAGNRGKGKSED